MINPEFVEFKTKDGLTLPGLLYSTRGKEVIINLHGNGSSSVFYWREENEIFAETLAKKDISIFYFNNRGAHIIKRLTIKKGGYQKRTRFGMAYEKIKDCIKDIDGAVDFLKKQGFKKFYLMGHSTGANKICVYSYYKPKNQFSKYILISGGDDTGSYYDMLGKNKFWRLLKEAKRKIKMKKGNDIIKDLLPNLVFSYSSFYDIANPDGDYNIFPFYEILRGVRLSKKPLFRHFKSLKKPALVIYGDKDEFCYDSFPSVLKILKVHMPNLDYKIIQGADHGYNGHEKKLAQTITNWL